MNSIKHIILSVVAFVAATDSSLAQTYSITPNDTVELTGYLEDLQTLSIQQLNSTNDTLNLSWQKVSESVPALWEASVCDNSFCYTSLIDSGVMNPVYPTEYGLLLLHITPHVNYGTATVRYAVWNNANPALKDTLTYILQVTNPTGISETDAKSTLRISPNPTNENILIVTNHQSGFEFLLTDVSGKEIKMGFANTNTLSVSTTELPNGIYNFSIVSQSKIITTQKLIVQH